MGASKELFNRDRDFELQRIRADLNDPRFIKDKIIYYILRYQDTLKKEFLTSAIEYSKKLANNLHIGLENGKEIKVREALYDFILNTTGFRDSLPVLYASLVKLK